MSYTDRHGFRRDTLAEKAAANAVSRDRIDKYGGIHPTVAAARERNGVSASVFTSLYGPGPNASNTKRGVVHWVNGKKHIDGVPVGGRRTRHRKKAKRSTRRS
jgi:hypothetical protein